MESSTSSSSMLISTTTTTTRTSSSSSSSSSTLTTSTLEVLYYGLVSIGIYQLLKLSKRYIRWYFTPLWELPGPKNKSFLLGSFVDIMKSPFMFKHYQWLDEEASLQTKSGLSRGDVDLIHYTGFLGSSSLLILNADYIKQILVLANYRTNPPRYLKKLQNLEGIVGKGLVTLEGEDWYRHRRIIHPSFQINFLKRILNESVPKKVITLIECWTELSGSNSPIDMSQHFSMLTLDVLGDVAFGHEFHGLKSIQEWSSRTTAGSSNKKDNNNNDDDDNDNNINIPPVSDRLIKSMNASLRASPKRIILSILGLSAFDLEARQTRQTLMEAIDDVIQNARRQQQEASSEEKEKEKKKKNDASSTTTTCCDDETTTTTSSSTTTTTNGGSSSSSSSSSSKKYAAKSLLELLLDAKDTEEAGQEEEESSESDSSSGIRGAAERRRQNTLNQSELRDEVKTFLIAGHETTSSWCYWSIYQMCCQNPVIQQKLYEDVMKHSNASSPTNNNNNKNDDGDDDDIIMDLEQIEEMEYLDAFLKEVLRFSSPVGMLIRNTVQEETFGETKIPPNTRLVIPHYLIHKSPRYWDNPNTFSPERWLQKDPITGKIVPPNKHPYAFIPFSAGPRNCIGYKFATLEAKLILAPLIQKFRFELTPELRDTEFTLTSFITVKAKPTVYVNAKLRDTSTTN